MDRSRKKRRKLPVQVGAVVIPAFIIMIFAVLAVVYNSTVDSFLEAHKSDIRGTAAAGRTALKRGRVSLCMGVTRLCVFIAQWTYALLM